MKKKRIEFLLLSPYQVEQATFESNFHPIANIAMTHVYPNHRQESAEFDYFVHRAILNSAIVGRDQWAIDRFDFLLNTDTNQSGRVKVIRFCEWRELLARKEIRVMFQEIRE